MTGTWPWCSLAVMGRLFLISSRQAPTAFSLSTSLSLVVGDLALLAPSLEPDGAVSLVCFRRGRRCGAAVVPLRVAGPVAIPGVSRCRRVPPLGDGPGAARIITQLHRIAPRGGQGRRRRQHQGYEVDHGRRVHFRGRGKSGDGET